MVVSRNLIKLFVDRGPGGQQSGDVSGRIGASQQGAGIRLFADALRALL